MTTPRKRELIEQDREHLWHPFTQHAEFMAREPEPLIITEAKGNYVLDIDGKRYFDGISSLWTNVHGHRNNVIDDAVRAQLDKVAHTTLLGLLNVPSIELAKALADITPTGLEHVFYSDAGATGVEIALKMAFQYFKETGVTHLKKNKFLHFKHSYHGDTLGAMAVGGIDLFHKKYQPVLIEHIMAPSPECFRCDAKDSDGARTGEGGDRTCDRTCVNSAISLIKEHAAELAAVVIEPLVMGAAGMLLWPDRALSEISAAAKENGVLLIADEVATGFGRTGTMFACEQEDVFPDIMVLAKGLTGGYLPLAATLATTEIYSAFLGPYESYKTFFHGHTYTGNPLACAAALANLKIFREEQTIVALGPKIEHLRGRLAELKDLAHVGEIRQKGFMVGIELVRDKLTCSPFEAADRTGYQVILEARRRGVILRPLGDVIVLMPPLSTTIEELDELVHVTRDSILTVTGERT